MLRVPPSQRSDYKIEIILSTRWDDNDMYGHLNNTVHYRLFDTAVNSFLMETAGFLPMTSQTIGLVVESGCRYFGELHFPQNIIREIPANARNAWAAGASRCAMSLFQ